MPAPPRATSRPALAAVVACSAAAVLPACVAPTRPFSAGPVTGADGRLLLRPGAGLVVDDASPLPDVPVPLRFTLLPTRSFALASAGTGRARDVTHVYEGRAAYDRLSAFFDRQLALNGWRPDPTGPTTGPIRAYAKGPEQLHLSLSEAQGVASVSVRIAERPNPAG